MIKRPLSITSKLWLAMTALILMVLGGMGIAITWLFGDFYLQQQLNTLENEATEMAAQLASVPQWSDKIALLKTMKFSKGVQLVLLDQAGNPVVLATDNFEPSDMIVGGMFGRGHQIRPTDFITAENIADVLQGRTISIRALPKDGRSSAMLISLVPIRNSSVEGAVLLGSSPLPMQQSIQTFKRLILYTSLVAVILAAFFSLLLARQVTRPLGVLQKAARRMAEGNFTTIQGIESKDEIGQLADSFNVMAESLRNHMSWLSEQRNLLQGIVESISDGVMMLSTWGKILYANDPAKAFWQAGNGEDTARKEEILLFIRKSFETGGASSYSLTLGTQVLEIGIAPIRAETADAGFVAVIRDVTASLRAEKERRDIMASVTHELRTPLHLIQGYLEAIQDGIIPQADHAEHIELVLSEAKRLARLVKELQDISRLERKETLNRQEIDIGDFLQEIYQRFLGETIEQGIHLELIPIEGILMADRDRLLQVFINLLDNALRHTQRGGKIQVQAFDEENTIRFAIRDEGEGISAEELPQIFNRFYRVDKARSRKEGGMGLGLAIVKQIMEAHGGVIRAESKLGQGTVFWLELPKSSDQA